MGGVRLVGAGIVLALLVSACGGGSDGGGVSRDVTVTDSESSTLPSSTTAVPAEQEELALAAFEAAFAEFDPAQLEAALAEAAALDREVEFLIAEWSGLQEELGGADAMTAAIEARDAAFPTVAELLGLGGPQGLRRAPAHSSTEDGVGMGLFGGLMIVGLGSEGIVTGTNDGKTGTRDSDGAVLKASKDSVELVVDKTFEGNGLTTNLRSHVKVFPCPDVNGEFTVNAKVDVTSKATGTSRGQQSALEVVVTGQLDDDARLVASSMGFRMKRDGLGLGSYVDYTYRRSVDGTGTARLNDFNWLTTMPSHIDDTAALGGLFAAIIEHFLVKAAAQGYESGRCVRLDVSAAPGPGGLEPGSTATVTAKPRSKMDGSPTGGTVKASLTAGAKAVDPSGTPLPADAEFTYSAPDEADQSGTVALEARSKRGVGKAEITLDTKGVKYVAGGGGSEITFSGDVASITAPFTVGIEFIGGSGTFDFIPAAGGDSGTVNILGSGGGASLTGGGTYTATKNDDGTVTLTVNSNSCVDVSNVCRDHVDLITLTPTRQP